MKTYWILAFLLALAAPATAFAQGGGGPGQATLAPILGVQTLANGRALVTIEFVDSSAACADLLPDQEAAWAIDTTTDAGQSLYANALFAASARLRVTIRGTGTCVNVSGVRADGAPFTGNVEVMATIHSPLL